MARESSGINSTIKFVSSICFFKSNKLSVNEKKHTHINLTVIKGELSTKLVRYKCETVFW